MFRAFRAAPTWAVPGLFEKAPSRNWNQGNSQQIYTIWSRLKTHVWWFFWKRQDKEKKDYKFWSSSGRTRRRRVSNWLLKNVRMNFYKQGISFQEMIRYFEKLIFQTRKWHSESADPAKALNLSLAKQTDKQKILATQMFELSTLAFLAQFSYRLSYRAVIIWLLISDYYYQINKNFWPHRGSNSRPSHF